MPGDWRPFSFGDASNDPAPFGNTGDDMNEQFEMTTGDSTKREVVYDKKSQRRFLDSVTATVTMCMWKEA
jgi:hypothetical protein